jgi:SNF2 family DNA or RNA helicase
MLILHGHWQSPRRSTDPGGMLFWAESSRLLGESTGHPPILHKGIPTAHPFTLPSRRLREEIAVGTPLWDAEALSAIIALPTSGSIPLPSSLLLVEDEFVSGSEEPVLEHWSISGLWLPAAKAFSVLINLPEDISSGAFRLGADLQYWRMVSNLVLESLALQKLLPTLEPADTVGQSFIGRWQPVMDGEKDEQRLRLLAEGMPSICRGEPLDSEAVISHNYPTPRRVVDSFMDCMCDGLMRSWTRSKAPKIMPGEDDPALNWIVSLFQEDAGVKASSAQLQALESGLRAWKRSLSAAGDSTSRVAFQLFSPQDEPASPDEKIWRLEYGLEAREDHSIRLSASQVWENGISSNPELAIRFKQPQEKLLAGLGYAARLFQPILPSLEVSKPVGLDLDTTEAYRFLRENVPLLEEAGFAIDPPDWWDRKGARLAVRLRLEPEETKVTSRLTTGKVGLDQLVRFTWELSLGGERITREEFERLAALRSPLVQIRGQWVQLETSQLEAARKFWQGKQQTGSMNLVQAALYSLGGEEASEGLPVDEVVVDGWVREWLQQLEDQGRLVMLEQPDGLKGTLRPYQKLGYSWLTFFRNYGMGACLADDMGLGKTIQALAVLLKEKETNGTLPGPVLLICPTSVVTNWQREVRKFSPDLTTLVHQGAGRLRGSAFLEAAKSVDLVLSSYAVVRQDAETILSIPWWSVILDEAQNIKNSSAKQTQVVRKLQASYRLALTGTPVENRLSELWSIMQFLNPGYLGPFENFRRYYSLPIERFGDKEAAGRLKKMVSPFILRRLKSDPAVIQDLPEKIEVKDYVNLSNEQTELYKSVVNDVMTRVQESTGIERRGQILSLLTQLKQICNHPVQWEKKEMETISMEDGFTRRSGKLLRLAELLEEIISEGDRVLLFTQYAEMGKLLSSWLPRHMGVGVQFLYGGTPTEMRDQMVKKFQEDPHGPPIFILSLKAGGIGLNLTRANQVIHFDRWWNPAVEDQATDRAYRIGQNRNVQVHKLITVGTLEERIDEMIESKKGLADAIITSGDQWLTEMNTDELRDMVSYRG